VLRRLADGDVLQLDVLRRGERDAGGVALQVDAVERAGATPAERDRGRALVGDLDVGPARQVRPDGLPGRRVDRADRDVAQLDAAAAGVEERGVVDVRSARELKGLDAVDAEQRARGEDDSR